MTGPKGLHRGDRLRGTELQASAVNLIHHRGADRFGGVPIAHQPVIGSQAEVDSGPYLQRMGAIRVERVPSRRRHSPPGTSTIEPLKTGFSYRLERAVAVGIVTTGSRPSSRA